MKSPMQFMLKLTKAFDLMNPLILSLKLWRTGVEPVGLLRISGEQ